jgi:hypothetical protein
MLQRNAAVGVRCTRAQEGGLDDAAIRRYRLPCGRVRHTAAPLAERVGLSCASSSERARAARTVAIGPFTQETTMSRAQTVSPSAQTPVIDEVPFADALQSQLYWLDQVIGLQTAWLTSLMTLQAEYWRNWSPVSQQLPAWMVWHNGTEQLA